MKSPITTTINNNIDSDIVFHGSPGMVITAKGFFQCDGDVYSIYSKGIMGQVTALVKAGTLSITYTINWQNVGIENPCDCGYGCNCGCKKEEAPATTEVKEAPATTEVKEDPADTLDIQSEAAPTAPTPAAKQAPATPDTPIKAAPDANQAPAKPDANQALAKPDANQAPAKPNAKSAPKTIKI